MRIRPYRENDRVAVRAICKETAWDSYKADPSRLESVPIMFCDYFIEREPNYVFVLADETDFPVGYILCATQCMGFLVAMRGEYSRRLEAIAPKELEFLNDFLSRLEKIQDRPVHFHIDLLPCAQRQGWGRKLMDTLCEKLCADGYRHLSACCVSRNSDGYQMYRKLGFWEFYDYGNDLVSLTKDLGRGENPMTMRERIDAGKLFTDYCEGLPEERTNAKKRMKAFNETGPEDISERMALMGEIFGKPSRAWIEPPFYFCYGTNITLGDGTYLNMGCNFVDDGKIVIGQRVMFGPNVTIATVGHPVRPDMRGLMYTDPVAIGDNCWIGAGSIICPGVTVGENSVIGAGSVVNRDIPANVVAVGNPCKVVREIGEQDMRYYYKDREFNSEDLAELQALGGLPEEKPK